MQNRLKNNPWSGAKTSLHYFMLKCSTRKLVANMHLTPEMADVIGYILTAIVGIFAAKMEYNANRRRKIDDEREARRQREARLSMDMMSASIDLGNINAIALQNGQLNGNVEAARKKAADAQEAYRNFLKDIGAEVI